MSKPLPILQHMPWNVKQKIVDSTDAMTKNSLRLVNKEYKKLVTCSPVDYNAVRLVFSNNNLMCRITLVIDEDNSFGVEFRKTENGYKITKLTEGEEGKIKSGDFFEAIQSYFAKILRNPKAHFGNFFIRILAPEFPIPTYNVIKKSILNPLQRAVSSLGHLIALQSLEMEFSPTNEDLHNLLSCFRPGALRTITVEANEYYLQALPQSLTDLSHVVELEQWKQASEFRGESIQIRVPIEKWSHFSNLEIEAPELSFNEAKELIEAVARSNHSCCHGSIIFRSGISQQLRDHFRPMGRRYGTTIIIPLHAQNTTLYLIIESELIDFVISNLSEFSIPL